MHEVEQLQQFLTETPKKYLIFDLDETLIKLHLPWGEFIDHVHQMLRTKDADFYLQHQDKEWSMWELMNAFVKRHGPSVREQLRSYARQFESGQTQPPTVYTALVDWLRSVSDHYVFSLWSSNTTPTIEKALSDLGVRQQFSFVVGHDSVLLTKPDPEGFSLILQAMAQQDPSVQSADFLLVGDSSSDEGAAAAAGIEFFKIKYFL